MTTTYTKIVKPTTSYNKISGGYVLYDDVSTTYDSSEVTYDGQNSISGWIKISKPTGGSATATAGLYYGFGMYTYSGGQVLSTDSWTKIPKGN